MAHLEVESKFEVPADGFETLKQAGTLERREEQLNVYYDANWVLANSSATLRVRINSRGESVLTLKLPISLSGNQRVMKEFEMPTTKCPRSIDIDRHLPREFANALSAFGIQKVERVGWVRNTRFVVALGGIGDVELDRLRLPDGTVFHEAEIETTSELAQERLADLVYDLVPAAKPSRVSKFQRFRQAAEREVVRDR